MYVVSPIHPLPPKYLVLVGALKFRKWQLTSINDVRMQRPTGVNGERCVLASRIILNRVGVLRRSEYANIFVLWISISNYRV